MRNSQELLKNLHFDIPIFNRLSKWDETVEKLGVKLAEIANKF